MRHLLLLPTDATRDTLLAEGPCGARVACVVQRTHNHAWRVASEDDRIDAGRVRHWLATGKELPDWARGLRSALPLIWEGWSTQLARVRAVGELWDRGERIADYPNPAADWMTQALIGLANDGAEHGLWTITVVESEDPGDVDTAPGSGTQP